MRLHTTVRSALVGCAALSLLVAAPAVAQEPGNDTTKLTFSGPVQVPGKTLAAGTYEFTIADRDAMRSVIQIWNEDKSTLIAQPIVVPTRRQEQTGELAVEFGATPEGVAPAIRAWFIPGNSIGHEFVYPKDQAEWIAKTSHTMVLTSEDDVVDVETVPDVPLYRVDAYGERYPYADPADWESVAVITMHDVTRQPKPGTPKALIADIEATIADALDAQGQAEVVISRAKLVEIQDQLERLRAAITTAPMSAGGRF